MGPTYQTCRYAWSGQHMPCTGVYRCLYCHHVTEAYPLDYRQAERNRLCPVLNRDSTKWTKLPHREPSMPTIEPDLSVLIPAIPERAIQALKLYGNLQAQLKELPNAKVEILMLMDDRTRSIGLKRQALLDIARGDYVVFVDDDDEIDPCYLRILHPYTLLPHRPEVISINHQASLNGGPCVPVEVSMEFENEELRTEGPIPGCTRKPMHTSAWRRDIATLAKYPDCSYGEDAYWAGQLWERWREKMICFPNDLAHHWREVRILRPLYTYRWSQEGTRAELTFPPDG